MSYQGKHVAQRGRARLAKPVVFVSMAVMLGLSSVGVALKANDTGAVVAAQEMNHPGYYEVYLENVDIRDDFQNVVENVDEILEVVEDNQDDSLAIVDEIISKVKVVHPTKRKILKDEFTEELEVTPHELTREEKLAMIEEIHQIDEFEYWQIVSTVAHEGGPGNYNECYDVICVAYNRTLSKAWCWSCKQETGKDGSLVIDQIRWIGQFSGFLPSTAGYDRDEYEGTAAEQATFDFLYSLERTNDFLCFNAPWYDKCPSSAVQLHPECSGNKYFRLLTEDDLNEKAKEQDIKLLKKTY